MKTPAVAFCGLLLLPLVAGCAPQPAPMTAGPTAMAPQPAPMAAQPAPMAQQPAPMAAQQPAPAYAPKETDRGGGGSGY
jgi:hypothetical protein